MEPKTPSSPSGEGRRALHAAILGTLLGVFLAFAGRRTRPHGRRRPGA